MKGKTTVRTWTFPWGRERRDGAARPVPSTPRVLVRRLVQHARNGPQYAVALRRRWDLAVAEGQAAAATKRQELMHAFLTRPPH